MICADAIAAARAVPIDEELVRRNIKLRGKVELTGPCPVCGGTDKFVINVRKQIWNCRGCAKGGGVIALARHLDGASFAEAIETLSGDTPRKIHAPRERPRESAEAYEKRQAEKACYRWLQRWPIAGTPAETYLREARGYAGPLPATLGFLEPPKRSHHPAMIAAFAVCEKPEPGVSGEPRRVASVHLTLLKPDGSGKADVKPNKLIVGRPLARPIVLAPPNDLLGLAITEGIEDALSVHAATGLGAWAAGSATFMPALAETVPDYIECVTIYAHPDKAGQDGARKLADVLVRRGVEIFLEGIAP